MRKLLCAKKTPRYVWMVECKRKKGGEWLPLQQWFTVREDARVEQRYAMSLYPEWKYRVAKYIRSE